MRFFQTIKFRLIIWHLAIIVTLLFVFSGVAYTLLANNLHHNLDYNLTTLATAVQTRLKAGENDVAEERVVEELNEFIFIYKADGTLFKKYGTNVELPSMDNFVKQALNGQITFFTAATSNGQEIRFYATSLSVSPDNSPTIIVVGRPVAWIGDVMATFRDILGLSGLIVLILAGIGGFLLANRALKPVDQITRIAQDIEYSDLSRRINVHRGDEFGRLASTLNRMFERLEGSFNRYRQFVADVSHELRTPLAVIQAETTLALNKKRTDAEYRDSLELVAQESAYMSSAIDKILSLARSDAGKDFLTLDKVKLDELLAEVSADVKLLANEKGIQFNVGPGKNLTLMADRLKLRQLLISVLENAVHYTPSGGSVSLSVAEKDGMAVVAIADTGIGIPSEHLPHIFERFYRVDQVKSRGETGTGLGLAIAKSIAEAHGGRMEAESEVGKGTTFYITLPCM
ncbi:MAG: ATP-binding protein [Dehalococcoidia bacterium]|jgi:heavy metal sensor kinase